MDTFHETDLEIIDTQEKLVATQEMDENQEVAPGAEFLPTNEGEDSIEDANTE